CLPRRRLHGQRSRHLHARRTQTHQRTVRSVVSVCVPCAIEHTTDCRIGPTIVHIMTRHPFVAVGSLALSFTLWASVVNAQALIRSNVALPSSAFSTYIEGEILEVSIPSNWRELPASNAVTFAPDGAYGNDGLKSVFTHGL